MEVKLFEVLDRGTVISVIVNKLLASHTIREEHKEGASMPFAREILLLQHSGLNMTGSYTTMLSYIGSGYARSEIDPHRWQDGIHDRTLFTAHNFIDENWDTLTSGDIVDVEVILGEKSEPSPTQMSTFIRG